MKKSSSRLQSSTVSDTIPLPLPRYPAKARYITPDSEGLQLAEEAQFGSWERPSWKSQYSTRYPSSTASTLPPYSGKLAHQSPRPARTTTSERASHARNRLAKFTAALRQGHFRTRRWWWWIGGIVALVILLAAVIGTTTKKKAVENSAQKAATDLDASTRPSNSSSADLSAMGSLGSQFPQQGRIKTTTGAWNGTGITTTHIENSMSDNQIRCGCWFQDFRATIQTVIFDFDDAAGNVTFLQSTSLPVTAANGTSLASRFWIDGPQSTLQLIYVDPEGILSDIYQLTPPFGPIQNGSLSSLRISVPLDNRPTLHMIGDVDRPTATMFTGTADQRVHSYLYDHDKRSWNPKPAWNFSDSSAYSGAAVADLETGTSTGRARVLFLSDQQGSIRGYLQQHMNSTTSSESGNWSAGDPWGVPIMSDQKNLPDTSFALNVNFTSQSSTGSEQHTSLLFGTPDGKLGARVLDTKWGDLPYGSFGAYDSSFEAFKLMQGSDIGFNSYSTNSHTQLIYQDDAQSLAWMVIDASGKKSPRTGRFVPKGTTLWAPG